MILVVSKKRYEKDLQAANEVTEETIKQLEISQKEKNDLKQIWLKEKLTFINEIKELKEVNQDLVKTNYNQEVYIRSKKEEYEDLRTKYKKLSDEKGGLKSALVRKDKKIEMLKKELIKGNPALYKVKKIKAQKTPKLKTVTILKNQKNSQVKAQLKSIGENNGRNQKN